MEAVDIWSTGAFNFESPLKDLLDSLDFTLEDLLGEDELLQELRGLHPQLVTFFSSEENVAGLIRCLVAPPPPSYEALCADYSNADADSKAGADVDAADNNANELQLQEQQELDASGVASAAASKSGPRSIPEHEELDDVDISVDDTGREEKEDGEEGKHQQANAPGQWLMDNITESINGNGSSNHGENGKKHQVCGNIHKPMDREEYEARYIRYPYMACEVICCELTQILDILIEGSVPISMEHTNDNNNKASSSSASDVDDNNENDDAKSEGEGVEERQSILDLLFSMLFTTPASQLDDRRAGYLEKILTVLFRTKRAAMTAYINGEHFNSKQQPSADGTTDQNKYEHDTESTNANGEQHEGEQESAVVPTNKYHKGGGAKLLHGLFKHLHSNSISQIVQRLLMPQSPSFANIENCNGSKEEGSSGSNTHDWGYGGNDDVDDEDDCLSNEMDDFGGINCNWADNELGIHLLLDHLMIDNATDGTKAGPAPTNTTTDNNHHDTETAEARDELRLHISQHACEILTSIIQHSPLSSNVMKSMTGEPTLTRLIRCIRGTNDRGEISPKTFSMHESAMTTAMHVLETIVLQLGGYGTVPTANVQGDCDDDTHSTNNSFDSSKTGDSRQNGDDLVDPSEPLKETEAIALMRLLPELLDTLASLLKHPDTTKWQSQFQYSRKPQKLLGSSRLRIVRLLESLVLLSIRDIDLVLCSSDCLQICLDLFWDFPWCSMLHQSVANLLVHVLEGGEHRFDLQLYFLTRCNLPKLLIDSFEGASYSTADDDSKGEDLTNHISSTIGGRNGEKMTYSAVLAMKNFDQTSGSSSVDASLGSDASTGNETDEIPVSDDDVEAAIEQEEQLKLYHEENEEKKTQQIFDHNYKRSDTGHSSNTSNELKIVEPPSNAVKKNTIFRLGYMGHVIIICQALVHACGSTDQAQNVSAVVEDKNALANERKEENVMNDSSKKNNETGDKTDKGEPTSPPRPMQRNMILSLLKGNRHYSLWQTFVTTTLASETAVQSTPLGGYNTLDESNAEEHQRETSKWETADQYVEDDDHANHNARNTNYVVSSGEIDLDETDLDIAATLMESMNLPSSEDTLNGVGNHSGHRRHHRQRGVIGGCQSQGTMNGNDNNGGGAEFGTVVQMHQKQESSGGYVYDDPLGARHDFLEDDEDEEAKGLEPENNDGENEVPVMDLFAGNFDFDDDGTDSDGENDDTGWANFDDAFGSTSAEFPSSLDDEIKSSTQAYESQTDPFSSPNDLFGMIADTASVISNFGFSDKAEKDNRELKRGGTLIEATEEDQ